MSYRRKIRTGSFNAFDERDSVPVEEVDSASFGGDLDAELAEASRQHAVRGPVLISTITIDQKIQVRVGGVDPETIETYTNILLEGGTFADPIVVFTDDENKVLYLADGFHRLEAYKNAHTIAESEPVPGLDPKSFLVADAEMHYGSFNDAFEYAEESNLKHGLRLNNKDKCYILKRRIKRGHAWATLSSNAIARELGVSDKTVTAWRSEILGEKTTSENSEVPLKRVGKDGRAQNTSNIGPKSKLTPEQKAQRQVVDYLHKAADAMEKAGANNRAKEAREWAEQFAKHWKLDDNPQEGQ